MARLLCHCGHKRSPATDSYVGSMVYPDLYAALFNCACSTTYALVLWEKPDELALVDGELGPLSHERDSRKTEAA